MAIRIQLRRDTAANWVTSNPVLREGELGIETDTLKIKIGNGSAWNSISNYSNVVPSDLNTTLGDYVTINDIGAQGGVVGLNSSYNAIIPGTAIILEGPTADSYETTLTVTDPTEDRTITIPDANGTLALTSDITSAINAVSTTDIEEGTNLYFTDERAQDATAAALAAGTHTNITVTYSDSTNALSLAAAPGYVDEQAVDAVAQALANGTHTNITVGYSDETNAISLTGAVTYTDENAQDAVGTILTGGLTYTDSTPAIGINYVTLGDTLLDGVSGASYGLIGTSTYLDVKTGNGYNKEIELDIAAVESKLVTDGFAKLESPTFTGTVTLPGAPSTANEAATKAYVDNITAGLNFHAAVHAATTTNLSATYNNGAGTLSASGTFPTIDGETILETERVLVKSQSDAKQNGIYVLTDDGDPSGTWVLTRASDADNTPAGEIAYGDFVFVQTGSANGGYGYTMTTTGTITLGTSNIVWTQFNAGQAVIAGNGLTETSPGTIAIDTLITQTRVSGVSDTEIGYLDGVTSAIQTQLNAKAPINSPTFTGTVSGITKAMVGLTNVEDTALSTWAGSSNITTLGTIGTGTWNATQIGVTKGGTGLTSISANQAVYGSGSNTITAGTLPIAAGGTGATTAMTAATALLPSQTSNSGKYLTNDGAGTLSWATVAGYLAPTIGTTSIASGATVTSITGLTLKETATATINSNVATTVDTNALSAFTTVKYVVSIKQGSKIRSSEIIAHTDGTSVDYAEFGVVETGGLMNGILVEAVASGSNCLLRVTITNAASTNATVKIQETLI